MAEEQSYTQERPNRGARGLTSAIILIVIGGALLLQNLGVIAIDWLSLLRYWPVFLILIGLDLLLGRSILGSIAVALVSLAILGGLIFWVGVRNAGLGFVPGRTVTREIQEELGNISALRAEITIGAADATITVLDDDRYAASGEYRTNERFEPEVTYEVQGSEGRLLVRDTQTRNIGPSFGLGPFGPDLTGTLNLGLNPEVPLDLIIHAGVGELTLDLSEANLNSLTVEGGVGAIRLILPAEGTFTATLSTGIGSFNVTVPASLNAVVEASGALSGINMPASFTKQGDNRWTTPAYSDTGDHAVLKISTAIGSIDVNS